MQLDRDDAVALLWQRGFPPRKIEEILSQCERAADDRERRCAVCASSLEPVGRSCDRSCGQHASMRSCRMHTHIPVHSAPLSLSGCPARRVAAYWAKGALRKSMSEHHFSLDHSRGPGNAARHSAVHHRDARPRARSGYNLPSMAMDAPPHGKHARKKFPSSPVGSQQSPMTCMNGNAAFTLQAPPAG